MAIVARFDIFGGIKNVGDKITSGAVGLGSTITDHAAGIGSTVVQQTSVAAQTSIVNTIVSQTSLADPIKGVAGGATATAPNIICRYHR